VDSDVALEVVDPAEVLEASVVMPDVLPAEVVTSVVLEVPEVDPD